MRIIFSLALIIFMLFLLPKPTSAQYTPPPTCDPTSSYNECCDDGLSQSVVEYTMSDGSGGCGYDVGACDQADSACDAAPIECQTSCPSGYTGTCGGHDYGSGCVCETAAGTCTPEPTSTPAPVCSWQRDDSSLVCIQNDCGYGNVTYNYVCDGVIIDSTTVREGDQPACLTPQYCPISENCGALFGAVTADYWPGGELTVSCAGTDPNKVTTAVQCTGGSQNVAPGNSFYLSKCSCDSWLPVGEDGCLKIDGRPANCDYIINDPTQVCSVNGESRQADINLDCRFPPPRCPFVNVDAPGIQVIDATTYEVDDPGSGVNVTLDWTSQYADTLTASSLPTTSWNGSKNLFGGSESIGPLSGTNGPNDYDFSLTCTNPDNPPVPTTVKVRVKPPPPVVNLTANPTVVANGGFTALSWTTTNNPTSCTASGAWTGSKNVAGGTQSGVGPLFSAGSLTTYTYSITCSNSSGSGSDMVIVSVTGSPDLIVESLNPTSFSNFFSGNLVSFSGNVRNIGGATASPSYTILSFDIGNNGSFDTTFAARSTPSLASGVTSVASWSSAWVATTGTHRFRICADTNNQVAESNENNNCSFGTFTVKSGTDLVAQSLSKSISSPTEGQSMTFSGSIKNQGNSSATASSARFCLDHYDCLNSSGSVFSSSHSVSSLAAGASSSTLTTSGWSATDGSHTLYLCADVGKIVSETSETNNCKTLNFEVGTADFTLNPPYAGCSGTTPTISLSWSSYPGTSSYRVFKNDGNITSNTATVTSTSYTDQNVVTSKDYQYYIEAVAGAATPETDWSSSVTALDCTFPPPPTPTPTPTPGPTPTPTSIPPPAAPFLNPCDPGDPTCNTCEGGIPKVTLSWTAPQFATSYQIWRYGNGNWMQIGTTNCATCTTFDDPTISPSGYSSPIPLGGTTYRYMIRAVNASGSSPDSNILELTTNACTGTPWIQTQGGDVHSNTGINVKLPQPTP